MVADEDQMGFYPRPKTRDGAAAWIERNLTLYQAHGFGFWLMESTHGGEFLGYCGIRPLSIDTASEIEMGWHIRKEFWSHGLATEAASACRDLHDRIRPFDISFVPDGTDGYDDLQQNSQVVERLGLKIPVASMADVTRSKRAAGREKDAANLLVLIDFLEKQERGGDSDR
jgi:hypothetical protein